MRRGHGQVYREKFESIAQLGDIVAIRQTDGFVTDDSPTGSPFYVVTEVIATPRWGGNKGILGIWSSTAAPAAPYQMDTAAQAGQNTGANINNAASVALKPNAFILQKRQVMQTRFLVKALPDSNNAYVTAIDDFDVTVAVPSATPRWGTQKVSGVLNAIGQGADPGDNVQASLAGKNISLTSGTTKDPFELANRTETFLYGPDTGGQVSIFNNGATTTQGAIGLAMAMFLMNLQPLPGVTTSDWFMGWTVQRPQALDLDDVIVIPWTTQQSPKGIT